MKRQLKIITVCSLAVISMVLSGCARQQVIESREVAFAPNSNGVVKTMTFNIRTGSAWWDGANSWNNRKQLVIDTMARNSADVIGLQEAQLKQVGHILEGLPQYAMYSAGRSDGKLKGESCAILYRQDRFEMLDSGTFWFSESPSKPGSKYWLTFLPRICSWVHLADRETNKAFYFYNLHLDHISQSARKKSVRLLARKISERKTNDPFIVAGDFNMELKNPAMKYFKNIDNQTSHSQMVDAWSFANSDKKNIGTHHGFSGKTSGPKIDHITVSEEIKVLGADIDQYARDGWFPSDHFPVIAELDLL